MYHVHIRILLLKKKFRIQWNFFFQWKIGTNLGGKRLRHLATLVFDLYRQFQSCSIQQKNQKNFSSIIYTYKTAYQRAVNAAFLSQTTDQRKHLPPLTTTTYSRDSRVYLISESRRFLAGTEARNTDTGTRLVRVQPPAALHH